MRKSFLIRIMVCCALGAALRALGQPPNSSAAPQNAVPHSGSAISYSMLTLTREAIRSNLFVFIIECGPQMTDSLGFEIDRKNVIDSIHRVNTVSGYYRTTLSNGILRVEPRDPKYKQAYLDLVVPHFKADNKTAGEILEEFNKTYHLHFQFMPGTGGSLSTKISIDANKETIADILIAMAVQCRAHAVSVGHLYDAWRNPLGDIVGVNF